MDYLPEALAEQVARYLLDQHDLASLRCTCRFWRAVLAEPLLWRTLLARRFGPAAAAGADAAASAGAGADGAPFAAAELLFRQMASLRRPAANMDRVIWLDGTHLQVVTEPGSTTGRAVRVHSVSWLELAARFPGVLPGRYCAAWRIRLQGNFGFTGARMIARVLPASCAVAAAAQAAGAGDLLLPILREDGVRGHLWQNAQHEPAEARTTLNLINRFQLDQAFQQEGSDFFELTGAPFEVADPSIVYLKFHSPQGHTSGVVFDAARLERLPQ